MDVHTYREMYTFHLFVYSSIIINYLCEYAYMYNVYVYRKASDKLPNEKQRQAF